VTYLDPTEEAARALFMRGHRGPMLMLNLLRFREVADYSAHPDLAPARPISGAEAFGRYVEHTRPHLATAGGELMLMADGGPFFIGPPDERWDLAMLVRQSSLEAFLGMAANADYLAGLGHERRRSRTRGCCRWSSARRPGRPGSRRRRRAPG